ncbi:glycosyltransferase family 4 protein [bacterium]|nr:glycosyltransferase family 4 protein [bacterium]
MSAKLRIEVFLRNLHDEKAVEVARRMPFLKNEYSVGVTYVEKGDGSEGVFTDSGVTLTYVELQALPPDDGFSYLGSFQDRFGSKAPKFAMASLPDPIAAAFLIAAKSAGVPTTVVEFDDEPGLISSFEELTALHLADLYLPATRNLQRTLTFTLPQLRRRVGNLLPHSADTTYIQLTKEDRCRLRQQLRVATEPKMITVIAPFDRRRDHDTLIEACAILKERGQDFILLLVGDGPERARIAEKVYALRLEDQVTIMDDPEDHTDILCATDIFALCTHFEDNSVPMIEAMAQGLAIAGTDVPGINDLIRDERSGRLAKAKDAESFATALIDLLAQEKIRKKLGSVARKCIENRGNLNQFMPALISALKKAQKDHKTVAKENGGTHPYVDLSQRYVNLQQKVREMLEQSHTEKDLTTAADDMDGFPIDMQVDVLEKMCAISLDSAPLAMFVRPVEKVLSERTYRAFPMLELRLLESLAAFYIDLGYVEGAEKVIENMEEFVSKDVLQYQFTRNRFSAIRSLVRLSQLYDFAGQENKRDHYKLELWEYVRTTEAHGNEHFHQQNAACLEALGEMKMALREMQKDALGAIRIHPDMPTAHTAYEPETPARKVPLRSVAIRQIEEIIAESQV